MDFYKVIEQRRSIRQYSDRPVDDAVLERLAHAVQLAPSACNRQPWRFEIVFNPQLRQKIGTVYTAPWLQEAPAVVVAIGNRENCWKRLEGTPIIEVDIGIAMEHLVLAAAAEGLGTCWICAFDIARMNAALEIQPPWSVEAISPLGYPAQPPAPLSRRPLPEIFQVVK
ncbi:nitroreductase family protein [Victivallis sp. Marseille-Q1083]|uniref:nitroreductase family protein n=1 Tax=Victivallis sp. Marseille-Q1083 TaxID=2717288 RepID=UPI00158D408E|nr:nitroreductase family protein [Victivallis sp. Marseille-Q1083]